MSRLLAVAAAARKPVIGCLGVAVLAAAGCGGSATRASVHAQNAGQPGGGHNVVVGAPIPVGSHPDAIAVGAGGVWVVSSESGTLTRIDPKTAQVVGTPIKLVGHPNSVAVGDGSVWVTSLTDDLKAFLTRVDPASGHVVGAPINLHRDVVYGVAVGADTIWVMAHDLYRIDPHSGRVLSRTTIPQGGNAVAVGAGAVWVASLTDHSVIRVDPRSGRIVGQPIKVSQGGPTALAAGAGGVWAADAYDGSVTEIDPQSNGVVGQLDSDISTLPKVVSVGAGSVWVSDSQNASVTRVDPSTRRAIYTFYVDNTPTGIAVGDGLAWIAVWAKNSVVRFAP